MRSLSDECKVPASVLLGSREEPRGSCSIPRFEFKYHQPETTPVSLRDVLRNEEQECILKPLPMTEPVWNIVHNAVVGTYRGKFKTVYVHPGAVSYTAGNEGFKRLQKYEPEKIIKRDCLEFGYIIEGGDLTELILFGDTEDSMKIRDKCFQDMQKWGKLWRDRAEDDIQKKTTCVFSRAEGDIGIEVENDCVTKVANDSFAERKGVKVGWRILKIGEYNAKPSKVKEQLENLHTGSKDDEDKYHIVFGETTPWPQEIKSEFLQKFLSTLYWRESILSACTLTCDIFRGHLVTQTIKNYVSRVVQVAFNVDEKQMDFFGKVVPTIKALPDVSDYARKS